MHDNTSNCDFCEVCSGQGAHGLSLCHTHLDAWLRSPERRALASVDWTEAYQNALDAFVRRVATAQEARA